MLIDEIDLHGYNYADAEREVDAFLNEHWDKNGIPEGELKIITGHSTGMAKIVMGVLELYELDYRIGGALGMDDSYIIIYNKLS